MPIYFIRHGQSEFNAVHEAGAPDSMIFDAPLTELGREQAAQARESVAELGIKQVITSPLTRALQTALCLFDEIAPIQVSEMHRELLIHSCDVGRPPAQLQHDFPMLDFAHLPERWWYHDGEDADRIAPEPEDVFLRRIAEFERSLEQIENRPVAIVGHGNAFGALIGRTLLNCEIHRYEPGGS